MNLISILEILAFIVGLLTFRRLSNKVFKWVVVFLGYNVANEWGAYYYSRMMKATNLPFYNIYSIIEISFFLLVLWGLIQNQLFKKLILVSLVLYICSTLIEIQFFSGWNKYHFLTMSFGCLLIFVFSCLYFFELLRVDIEQNIVFYPPFWLVSAILFFHLFLLVYILNHYFFPAVKIQHLNRIILQVTNIVFYSFITISFLCHLPRKKLLN